MRKLVFLALLLIGWWRSDAQAVLFTSGVTYTSGAPTHNPGRTNSRVVIDTATWTRYEHVGGTTWAASGLVWGETSGCATPTGTPTKHQTIYRTNQCTPPKMYKWTGAAWVEMGTGTTVTGANLTAGSSKVSVTGGTAATLVAASVDVVEANLTLNNIGGTLGISKGGTGLTAVGTDGTVVGSNGSANLYLTPTVTTFNSAAAFSRSASQLRLNLPSASTTITGLVTSSGSQSFGGSKNFLGPLHAVSGFDSYAVSYLPALFAYGVTGTSYVTTKIGVTLTYENNTIVVDTLSTSITISLPECDATKDGWEYTVQKIGPDAYGAIIDPYSTQTFTDAAATKTLTGQFSGAKCKCRWVYDISGFGGVGDWIYMPTPVVSAGTGISVSTTSGVTMVTNTGDTNASDDLTTSTSFSGDVTGLWNNLQLGANVVTTAEIAANTITGGDIASLTIGAGNIANGAIGAVQIANASITTADIAPETINNSNIENGSILGEDIGPSEIGPTELESTAVTAGTYGDHVNPLTITVDADGRITDAVEKAFNMSTYTAVSGGSLFVWDEDDFVVEPDPTLGYVDVELQTTMYEGRIYNLFGANNATNNIRLLTSGSPQFMKISGGYGATETAYTLTAGQHLEVVRRGNTYYVSKK